MSLQAYQQVQNTTEDPRRTEYRLFAQVTRALIEAAKDATPGQLARAIHCVAGRPAFGPQKVKKGKRPC